MKKNTEIKSGAASAVTIKEVAELAGVSTATVSYVINNTKNVAQEKRQRVLAVIEESGYTPNHIAKSLRVKKTNTIGVLVEDIMGYPVPAIINGISERVEKSGYRILLNDLRMLESLFNQYDQILQQKDKVNEAISVLLFGARVDAIIYVGMFDRNITGIINEIDKPLVIAYSTSDDKNFHSVTYDNENISAKAIRYLLDLEHRRIAVITGLAHTSPARMRMRGIQRAFSKAGMVLDSALVKNGDWEYGSGYSCMMELLSEDVLPTAVFVMNDLMAAGAMDAIRTAGLRMPEDISVIGFDNREFASYLNPKLTTIEINLKKIGLVAAETALGAIHGANKDESNFIVPSRLIKRDTTAKAPGRVENQDEAAPA